jgi:hypothetical protein
MNHKGVATITETPTKRLENPIWNLGSVGSVTEAWKSESFEVPTQRRLSIRGWAVDQIARAAAGGVEITIDWLASMSSTHPTA